MKKKMIAVTLAGALVLSSASMVFANPGKGKGPNFIPPGHAKKTVTEQVYGEQQKGGPPAFVIQKHIDKFTAIDGKRIKVKGKHINFDVPPVIKEGRTLIPVRAVTMGLGASVEWHPNEVVDEDDNVLYEEGTIVITKENVEIKLVLGSAQVIVTVDGEDVAEIIDVPAGLIDDRTFVPIRFISEIFGEKVTYNEETGEIEIGDQVEDAESAQAVYILADGSADDDVYVAVTEAIATLEDAIASGNEEDIDNAIEALEDAVEELDAETEALEAASELAAAIEVANDEIGIAEEAQEDYILAGGSADDDEYVAVSDAIAALVATIAAENKADIESATEDLQDAVEELEAETAALEAASELTLELED